MHEGNFGVDTCGNTVLLDFGHIGRLPLSFAKYTIRSRGNDDDSFVGRVAKLLCLPDNSNMESMARISSCLWMAANPKLGVPTCVLEMGVELMFVIGLGEDGRPKPKPKRVKR